MGTGGVGAIGVWMTFRERYAFHFVDAWNKSDIRMIPDGNTSPDPPPFFCPKQFATDQ